MTTTTSDDESALLASIIAHPDEDTPRLMLADVLEERGQAARAELIRAQVERDRLPRKCGHDRDKMVYLDGTCRNCELCSRERDLLAVHRDEWFAVECPGCGGSGTKDMLDSDGELRATILCRHCSGSGKLHAVPHRGFAHRVEGVRMGELFERPGLTCMACFGTRRVGASDPASDRQVVCPVCHGRGNDGVGDWQPTPWLLAVVRQYPTLVEVAPIGLEPYRDDGHPTGPTPGEETWDIWDREEAGDEQDPSAVPSILFNALVEAYPKQAIRNQSAGDLQCVEFATRAEAITVAARAIVTVARAWVAKGGGA